MKPKEVSVPWSLDSGRDEIEDEMRRRGYKREVQIIVSGACESVWYHRGTHRYYIGETYVDMESCMIHFQICRSY